MKFKFVIIKFIYFSIQFCFNLSQLCPNQCNCNLTLNFFQVECDGSNSINLTSYLNNINVATLETIIIKNSNLQTFPGNLCTYNKLRILDLSNNQIASNITGSLFSCLFDLSKLNLSSNRIQYLSENAFNFNSKLIDLDLSYNLIEQIPLNLFPYKLDNLQNLYLQGNLIMELDMWYFYLKQIKTLDLRFNKIAVFKNDINFKIDSELIYSSLAEASLIDLRYNLIKKFDDDILKLYSICNETTFLFFIRLLYTLRIDENPLECNCSTSFNFLNFFLSLSSKNFFNTDNNIFKATCTNSKYLGQSIFNFLELNTDKDCLVDFAFTDANCPFIITTSTTTSTTTTSTTTQTSTIQTTTLGFVIPQNLLNEPTKTLNETSLDSFNDSQIAGYIIGLIGILFLFLLLMYFLCPIEILAICFDCFPFFYQICPCKSGVKRDKEYDLFISFNRVNENWVHQKLIPFITDHNLLVNYKLHYDMDNKSDEIFGNDTKTNMNRSSCILFILSDAFLMKEWSNDEFRQYTTFQITREKTRFIAIQMHDICDEEVNEYFTEKLQIPNFISLENDEIFFWKKLAYFLYTNSSGRSIQPIISIDYLPRPNDDINFDPYYIDRPIISIPNTNQDDSPNTGTIKKKPFKINSTISKDKPKKIENKYEILRLNNEYSPKEKESSKFTNSFEIENEFDRWNKEQNVDTLILTKENKKKKKEIT